MKHFITVLSVVTATLVVLTTGCKKSDGTNEEPTPSGASAGGIANAVSSIDLTTIQDAFSSATGAIKAEWDTIVAAVKSADYQGALSSIQSLASNAGLSAEQRSALSELMNQVKAKTGDFVRGAADAAGNAFQQTTDAAGQAVDQAKEAASNAAEKATDAANKARDLLPK